MLVKKFFSVLVAGSVLVSMVGCQPGATPAAVNLTSASTAPAVTVSLTPGQMPVTSDKFEAELSRLTKEANTAISSLQKDMATHFSEHGKLIEEAQKSLADLSKKASAGGVSIDDLQPLFKDVQKLKESSAAYDQLLDGNVQIHNRLDVLEEKVDKPSVEPSVPPMVLPTPTPPMPSETPPVFMTPPVPSQTTTPVPTGDLSWADGHSRITANFKYVNSYTPNGHINEYTYVVQLDLGVASDRRVNLKGALLRILNRSPLKSIPQLRAVDGNNPVILTPEGNSFFRIANDCFVNPNAPKKSVTFLFSQVDTDTYYTPFPGSTVAFDLELYLNVVDSINGSEVQNADRSVVTIPVILPSPSPSPSPSV